MKGDASKDEIYHLSSHPPFRILEHFSGKLMEKNTLCQQSDQLFIDRFVEFLLTKTIS